MKNQDLQGHRNYRYLVPIVYALSWLSMIVGPWMFPIQYGHYCMCIAAYLAIRSWVLCGQNAQLVINSHNLLKKAKSGDQNDFFSLHYSPISVYHAFVIPNYNEPIELLMKTLEVLSLHKRARSCYMIFLAMEMHEPKSQQKAMSLVKKFYGKFLHISYTIHKLQERQHQGKASNVDWCVRKMAETFEKLSIQEESAMINVLDADSWVPEIYIEQVENHLIQNYDDRHLIIFQPPQIYTRNFMEVSVLIRTYDDMYSSMHAASMISLCGISFSLSNYTLSYALAKRVGFWDTNQEAIGEDMHMCLKTMFKTHGKSGNGTFSDLKEKFWQVERHARGVADIGYCLNMLSKTQWTFKTLWMTLSLMETFFLPIVTPWPLIVVFIQFSLKKFGSNSNFSNQTLFELMFLITIANTGTFLSNMIYEIFKRRSNNRIFRMENGDIFRILECSILSSINLMFLTVPAFVVGCLGILWKNREYWVSKKGTQKVSKKQNWEFV